jgi:hypothetical protein
VARPTATKDNGFVVLFFACPQVSRNGLRRIVEALFATLGNAKTAQLLLVHVHVVLAATAPRGAWHAANRTGCGDRSTQRSV